MKLPAIGSSVLLFFLVMQCSVAIGSESDFVSKVVDSGAATTGTADVSVKADTTITVGSKTFTTTLSTTTGTPVVPLWKAQMPSGELSQGAGFEILDGAEHASVWIPESLNEGTYNHYACLIRYEGQFFAMWGNHPLGEDAPGQRVLYSRSDEWGQWTSPEELFPPPGPIKSRSEDGIHLKPDRWAMVNNTLYAITFVHEAGRYPIARSVDSEGNLGEPFLLSPLEEGDELPSFMDDIDPALQNPIGTLIKAWYHDNDLIPWWAWASPAEWGVGTRGDDGSSLIESFSYRATDGHRVLMMRNWGTPSNPVHNNRIYVTFKNGEGAWAPPYPTNIPDSPSRAQALTLKNGTILLIGNQNVSQFDEALYLTRDPMTVSISQDGYYFDKVFALRTGAPSAARFPQVGGKTLGYGYPSALIYDGWLYVLYSIAKEDMAITRVPLSSLGLKDCADFMVY